MIETKITAPMEKFIQEFNKRMMTFQLINERMKTFQLINSQFLSQLEKLTAPIERMQAVVNSFKINIPPIFDVLKGIDVEGLKEFYEEFGWFECLPMPYAMELKKKLKENGKEAVWEEFIQDFRNEETINVIIKGIEKNKLVSIRKHILLKALEHHKNKDYISSIPLLLAQIEGILWDYGISKNKIKNEFNSRVLLNEDGSIMLNRENKPIKAKIQHLLTLLFEGNSKFKEQLQGNVYTKDFRHPILHGRNVNYANEQRSVLLLLLLYVLIDKIDKQ